MADVLVCNREALVENIASFVAHKGGVRLDAAHACVEGVLDALGPAAVDSLRSIEGVTSVAVEDQDQAQVVVVQAANGHEPTHAILERLQGVSLGRVTTREPTLEDAYVALVTEE